MQKMDEQTKNYWDKLREFNLSRTDFWWSFGFQLFLTIAPFIVLWLLLGPDFKQYNFNHYLALPTPQSGYLVLILTGYFGCGLLGNFLTWIFKWQKADSFTFTFGLGLVFISVIANGIWISEWSFKMNVVKILIRFVLALFFGLVGVIFGLLIATFTRNWTYKKEEANYALLLSYKAGHKIASKDQKNLKKAFKEEKSREQLLLKRNNLEQKLTTKYNNYQKQKTAQEAKIKAQAAAKEIKKRQKDQKKHRKNGF